MAIPPLHEIITSLRGPSTDEFRDTNAQYEAQPISRVDNLKGCEIFIKPCGCQSIAVAIDDIELYRGIDGFLTIGKLLGRVTWGDIAHGTAEIDESDLMKSRGWNRVDQFDNRGPRFSLSIYSCKAYISQIDNE